jgi:predicted deacylase
VTASRAERRPPFVIAGNEISAGKRKRVEIPVARLPATQVFLNLPVEVVHGKKHGPCVWLSSTIHGDELNGIEVVRQVRQQIKAVELRGTLLLVPIVNSFGFLEESRYLPDRRDLNRSFPGSKRGSLAGRLASIFMEQVVGPCSHGIDLHTAATHRCNLPQIRANLEDEETRRCALDFAAHLSVHSPERDGSLRSAASALGKHVLLYEAGEAQRYDDYAIQTGVAGVLRVLRGLDMLDGEGDELTRVSPIARSTRWIRARASGLLRLNFRLGDQVSKGERLGHDLGTPSAS